MIFYTSITQVSKPYLTCIVAVTVLFSGCALMTFQQAAVSSRAQSASNAARNTADYVQGVCSDPSRQAAAQSAAAAARAAATKVDELNNDYQQASRDLVSAQGSLLDWQREVEIQRNRLAQISLSRTDALEAARHKIAQYRFVSPETLKDDMVRTLADAKRYADFIDQNSWSSPSEKTQARDAIARIEAAIAAARNLDSNEDIGPYYLDAIRENYDLQHLAAELDLRYNMDQEQRYTDSVRDTAKLVDARKAALQSALSEARNATLQADALAQQCGGYPVQVRIPSYNETFWDIASP